jgi:hypothetical protein
MTRQQIAEGWLPDFLPAPDGTTLCRWLVRAFEQNQVCRDGTGRRHDPYRYWLPGQEKRWNLDPWWEETKERLEAQARELRMRFPHLDQPGE